MDSKQKNKVLKSLEIIAEKEGISAEEAKNEIALAVSYALKSNNLQIQNFWKNIPCKGVSPTVEEIIEYVATELSKQK